MNRFRALFLAAAFAAASALPSRAADEPAAAPEGATSAADADTARKNCHPLADDSVSPEEEVRILEHLKTSMPAMHERLLQMKNESPPHYQRMLARWSAWRERGRPGGVDRHAGPENAGDAPPADAPGNAINEELRENMRRSDELQRTVRRLAAEYRAAAAQRQTAIRQELRTTVSEAFDLNTRRRALVLEESEKRLAEAQKKIRSAREQLEQRIARREQHIDAYLGETLGAGTSGAADAPASAAEKTAEKNE